MPARWTQGPNQPLTLSKQPKWWRQLHDPILNQLIEELAPLNLDVKKAEIRIKVAQKEYQRATAQLLPVVAFTALPPNGTGVDLTQVLALTATITPDFFGRVRQTQKRMLAFKEVEEANRNYLMLNLTAEITSSYLTLREAQARAIILQKNIQNNQHTLHFLQSRFKSGINTYIPIALQTSLMETQKAKITQNRALIRMLIHKIEQLTGQLPGQLSKRLLSYHPMPTFHHPIRLGVPSELLRRRPDIIAAERRVAGAHANIRIALASLFPPINLGWMLGWQTQTIASSLMALNNPESTFFGTTDATLLNFTQYQTINVKKGDKQLAILDYRKTVLKALHEVETQYNYCKDYQESLLHFKKSVKQQQLALRLLRESYEKSDTDFNTVLQSESTLMQLELAYLHHQLIENVARINLYQALGGEV